MSHAIGEQPNGSSDYDIGISLPTLEPTITNTNYSLVSTLERDSDGINQSRLISQEHVGANQGRSHRENITVLKQWGKRKKARTVNATILGERYLVRIEASNRGNRHSRKSIKLPLRKMFKGKRDFSKMTHVDRIYSINLDHRYLKCAIIMESLWLSKQDFPSTRFAAKFGHDDSCVPTKPGSQCIGISGLAQMNIFIMEQ